MHRERRPHAQIEDNSRRLEAAMYQQTADAFSRWHVLLAQDAEVADLWRRGLNGEKRGSVERTRFHAVIGILFNSFESERKREWEPSSPRG